ncbi:hypothetical protein SARC_15857 [Sphaeroforma arctica JP610]|uniref:Ketopantoate reductase N-terminal domain-containing protein n=1 Tax=Sphaeroforma arctica JP610 TaxID=667725 RepID=A0A0L0F4G4_9EUKA|nr:hypothetical protein SARC_15857 [Sphaeroforma arctica JP610]KNC71605.1 hypothetical protein SARC_15857 [Sphaeroforma arctica JP610]|eukprot:XP_014145507.1 hypothetical protein SARC_15857 [Sphaeroforma arctica JP610]
MGKCDTILVCLKTTSNHKLSQLLPPLMHDKSTVILVQNGYGLEKNLAKQMADLGKETKSAVFPVQNVYGLETGLDKQRTDLGLANILDICTNLALTSGQTPFTAGKNIAGGLGFIASQKSSPGIITHVDYGKLTVGAHISPPTHTHTQAQADHSTPPHTHSSTAEPMRADHEPAEGIVQEAMRVLAEDLGEAGVEVVIDDDLVRARWHKLVWNISMNGLSVLLDAQTDEIVGNNGMGCSNELYIRDQGTCVYE